MVWRILVFGIWLREAKANQLAHFQDINTFDVIPIDNLLIMIGNDGLYQYDYTNLTGITLLSMIPIYSK